MVKLPIKAPMPRFLPEDQRQEIVRIARTWIGTQYHHQASLKGVGCDCLGLVRGVFEEFYGCVTDTPPPYSRAWGEADGQELMLEAAHRYLVYVGDRTVYLMAGDILVFRIRRRSVAKHAAVYAGNERMIHAFESAPVCEVELQRAWRMKIAGVFQFPYRGASRWLR